MKRLSFVLTDEDATQVQTLWRRWDGLQGMMSQEEDEASDFAILLLEQISNVEWDLWKCLSGAALQEWEEVDA